MLYRKLDNGGYQLIGAMYTVPKRATLAQLDQRVPLSVAEWHLHTNLCLPPKGERQLLGDARELKPRFGLHGSIVTEAACTQAGGSFHPTIFGWMVHVDPFARDPKLAWGTHDEHHEMLGS